MFEVFKMRCNVSYAG